MKKYLKFIYICLLSLIMVGCNEDVSTPQRTADRLVSSMYNYGGTSLYVLLHIENDGRFIQDSDLKGKIHNITVQRSDSAKERGGIKKVEYGEVQYINSDKTRAALDINITFNDDSTQYMPITLVKIKDRWLVELII